LDTTKVFVFNQRFKMRERILLRPIWLPLLLLGQSARESLRKQETATDCKKARESKRVAECEKCSWFY